MAKSNKQVQADFKARMRTAGLVQVQVWIQPDRKGALEQYARDLREFKRDEDAVLWILGQAK